MSRPLLKKAASCTILPTASSLSCHPRESPTTDEHDGEEDKIVPQRSKSSKSVSKSMSKSLDILRKLSGRSHNKQPAAPARTVRVFLDAIPHMNSSPGVLVPDNQDSDPDMDAADPAHLPTGTATTTTTTTPSPPGVLSSSSSNILRSTPTLTSYPLPPTAAAIMIPLDGPTLDYTGALRALDLAARQTLMFADELAFYLPHPLPQPQPQPQHQSHRCCRRSGGCEYAPAAAATSSSSYGQPTWDDERLRALAAAFLRCDQGYEVVYRCDGERWPPGLEPEWMRVETEWEKKKFREILEEVASWRSVAVGEESVLQVHLTAKFLFRSPQ